MEPPKNSHEEPASSQASEPSQTAEDFISSQLRMEADAREALPYQFDTCTKPLGALRQSLYACLTCNPPESKTSDTYQPAGVCYSCSISCHGEHELVELFTRRNFTCDCGTTRLPSTSPCALRVNPETGNKGDVHSEKPHLGNRYNQNFRNRFCGCGELYDPTTEKGTMFQCVGLGTVEDGGCGEDWWHPECLVGLPRDWHTAKGDDVNYELKASENTADEIAPTKPKHDAKPANGEFSTIPEDADTTGEGDEPPLPPNFPSEEDFEQVVCYKCTEAFPWIKRYAASSGFLARSADPKQQPYETRVNGHQAVKQEADGSADETKHSVNGEASEISLDSKKRKAEDSLDALPNDEVVTHESKKMKPDNPSKCLYDDLPPIPTEPTTLFLTLNFRDHLCRCSTHFPLLTPHPALLEEEASYEPPMSDDGDALSGNGEGSGSVGSRSLLDRGEAALSNMDRVRAIEGVMAYNHLKDKVKGFLKPFADSGTPVGAEDVKKYFEKLRGDEEGMREAGMNSANGEDGGGGDGDNRREQSGY
ncbi:MAG: hypothetical protein M1831_006378 [Alyxoria varia]|nr:MAG: hypothetical protein M1831_006378 [Alyxoria varia]